MPLAETMIAQRKFAIALWGALIVPTALSAAPPDAAKISGSIAGFVRDAVGIPQMGATVLLFNRYDRLIARGLTNERGVFGFDALSPDSYSVRVTLASFVPALRQKIAVQPGMQSLLYINMASVFSSVELVYAAPGQGALMSDDFKWTLKGSVSTRPILRMLPDFSASDPSERPATSLFSDTRGLVNLSAGDPGSFGSALPTADLGTAFALATSLYGRTEVQVSGNLGYATGSNAPMSGFRTSFSHDGAGPEVAVTMRQLYLPERSGLGIGGGPQDGLPALRTMSLSMTETMHLTDGVTLDYGSSMDSVSFIDHMNYISPFARLTYDLGTFGSLQLAYSSGAPPAELFRSRNGENGEPTAQTDDISLAQELAALATLPRISLRDERARLQRTQDFELGFEKKLGDKTIDLTAYREIVGNATLAIMGAGDAALESEILPDLSSRTGVFNIGGYQRYGYSAGLKQSLGDRFEVGVSFGRSGGLTVNDPGLAIEGPDDLRSRIQQREQFWASARATAIAPVTGTRITASYQWLDGGGITPDHLYLTQMAYPQAGLNIGIRQPIPSFFGMPGRVEATAELRNMLAQGYLPLEGADNRALLLMQTPRAVRGGLSFIF